MKYSALALAIFFVGFNLVAQPKVIRKKKPLFTDDEYVAVSYEMFVPKPLTNHFVLGTSLLRQETRLASGTESIKADGYAIHLNYAHAFSNGLALFLNQNIYAFHYEAVPASGSWDVKGLSPTQLGFKGLVKYLGSFFYYSAAYQAAVFEARNDADGINVFTPQDLRDNVELSAGFGALLGGFSLGGQYKYYNFQSTTIDHGGTKTTYGAGAGAHWKVYGQLEYGAKFGLGYGEETTDEAALTTGGSEIRDGYAKSEFKRIQIYTVVPLSLTTDFLFDVTKTDSKSGSYSKYDSYAATVGVRILF